MRSGGSSKQVRSPSLSEAAARLAEAGCDTPMLDADLLLREGGVASLERRIAREPVAYILGRKSFRWIELAVDRRVLIPRPDTETLVEVALELAPSGARVHDVGTGSGAVALALKHERADLVVSARDASADAVEGAGALALALKHGRGELVPSARDASGYAVETPRANAERLDLDVAASFARGL